MFLYLLLPQQIATCESVTADFSQSGLCHLSDDMGDAVGTLSSGRSQGTQRPPVQRFSARF